MAGGAGCLTTRWHIEVSKVDDRVFGRRRTYLYVIIRFIT
jgi:hypothetical protein